MVKSVAIIGGGPAGLITLDALLLENTFDVVRLFERRSEAGGCWVFDPAPPEKIHDVKKLHRRQAFEHDELPEKVPAFVPKSLKQRFMDTATYSYLETNVEATVMEFSKEPFPPGGTDRSIAKYGKDTPFRHNTVVKGWLQDLYKKKGYHDHVVLDTSVELVDKIDGGYDVTLRKFGFRKDYVWKEHFDAVVVATGHYDVPYVPDIPGLQEFIDNPKNIAIHSKAYRSREFFRGKKTVVVGASVSAMDAVQDILAVAQTPVYSSQRKNTKGHLYFGDVAFKHPAVEVRAEIVRIDNETNTLHFNDDTSLSGVEAIIFGTGFSYAYPFLKDIDLTGNRVNNVYQHIFTIGEPTLAFVGAIQAGLTFKAFEWQAVAAARVLAGNAELPSIDEQKEWQRKKFERVGKGEYTAIYPYFEEYFELLRKLAGEKGPGRRLPPWNPVWEEHFWRGHQRRMNFWVENNHRVLDAKVQELALT